MPTLGPLVDCNVHLWDQRDNPVFWLADRTLVRDLLGNYESLPDVYALADYERETEGFDVRGIVWSDAGAEDPVSAAEWVASQHEERGLVTGIVSLRDPAAYGFGELVDRLRRLPLVRSVRVRLAGGLVQGEQDESTPLDQPAVMEHFALLARHDLVATVEARLAEVAASPNVATRLDAIGTIFGAWTAGQVRPWLLAVVTLFSPDRCMLGSDPPIERPRSGFDRLYRAYDEILAEHTPREREMLLRATAEQWFGRG